MISPRQRVLRGRPELKPVKEDQNQLVLEWAHSKGYINLTQVEKYYYYSPFDLEVALMWKDKEDFDGQNQPDGD